MKSLSNKRLLITGLINGCEEVFLVDTGASVALIDLNYPGLKLGKKYHKLLVGAGGKVKSSYLCNTPVIINDRTIMLFITADIENIQDSIKEETGHRIIGIISLPQMLFLGMLIDLVNDEINFK